MNEKIIIKNFGPLKQLELDLKEIMVFIGPQASGKSTIAKLIHFFKYVNGENRIYFEENQYITLDRASSGQQEVLPLILILMDVFYSKQLNFVTIEEPEAHLYPYSQYKLIDLISRVHHCHVDKNRFIVTTHSPYILTAFNNFLFSYRVAQVSESAQVKVKTVIPEASWLNPKQLAAYSVREGRAESILNESTGLIADNEIDEVSEDIAGDFDALLEIYRAFKHENG